MNYLNRNQSSPGRLAGVLLALSLAGCATLPDQDAAPVLKQAGSTEFAHTSLADWPAADWWQQFHDPQLRDLIQRALAQSPDMAVAQARLKQAAVSARSVAASAGANLAADGAVTRQRFSDNYIYPPPLAGSYMTSGQFDLEFSYDLDFWGRNRSALQAALGERDAAQADAYAAASALSTAVARSYFQWQGIQAHIAAIQAIEAKRGELIRLEGKLVDAGLKAGDNLHPLVADQAAPGQLLVQLHTQAEQTRYGLQALVGDHDLPSLKVQPLPEVNGGVPENVHIDLLARRADVNAARLRVQATLKDVDSARAAFYPDFSISAFLGMSSLSMGSLLHTGSRELGISPALHLPLFDAGRLRANLDTRRAEVDLAVAEYDQAITGAVSDVNGAVVRLNGAAQEHIALDRQRNAHQRAAAAAGKRLDAGLGTEREVLGEQLAVLSLDDQEVTRHTNAVLAQVDLIKALGGGYLATQTTASAQ